MNWRQTEYYIDMNNMQRMVCGFRWKCEEQGIL